MKQEKALSRAIDHAGGQAALASKIGCAQSTVSGWLKSGQIGARHAIVVHKLLNGQVSAHDLRPDLYPKKLVSFN